MTPLSKTPNLYAPPSHLSPSMRQWWRDLNRTFDFEPHQLKILRLACEAYDRAQQARSVLQKRGLTYTDRFGAPKPRPEVAIERDARIGFARLVRELSLGEEPAEDVTRPPRMPSSAPKGKIEHVQTSQDPTQSRK
jgi:phage terminase small subunit